MVVKKGYNAVGAEEVIRHFFGIGLSEVEPATEEEIETFLFLIDVAPEMAIDYLNCWLSLKKIIPLDDCVLSNEEFFDIIKSHPRKKKKGKK